MIKSKLNDDCNEANNHQPVEVTFDPLEVLDRASNQTKATSVPVGTTEEPTRTYSKPTITTPKPKIYSKNDPQKDDISNSQIIKTNHPSNEQKEEQKHEQTTNTCEMFEEFRKRVNSNLDEEREQLSNCCTNMNIEIDQFPKISGQFVKQDRFKYIVFTF